MGSRQTVDKQLHIVQTSFIMLHAVTCLFIKPCSLLAESVPSACICQAPSCNGMHTSSYPAFPYDIALMLAYLNSQKAKGSFGTPQTDLY